MSKEPTLQQRRCLATLLLSVCCMGVSAAWVCPDITPAANTFLLEVSNANFTLPSGKKLSKALLYNSSYIGPLITAALGDEISVDVSNQADVGTSVHWHGMDLVDGAWADGVDGVTQRPIPPGETFRYKFKAEPAGTLWYHSHVGMQFADGLRGPLVITDPDDPYKDAYDEEVVLLLTDQNAESGEEELKALQEGKATMAAMGLCANVSAQDWSDAPFTAILVNGKGFMVDGTTKKPVGSPYVVKLQKGKRYRFRVIQGAASWGIKVKVQRHGISVIALDGSNVKATPAKGFVLTPGERVDFILHANQSVGNYWMDIATLTGDNSPVLLSYVGADTRAARQPQMSLGCDWARDEPGVLDFKNRTLVPHSSIPPPPQKPDVTLGVYLINGADPAQTQQAVLGSMSILGMTNTSVVPRSGCTDLPDGHKSAYCWTLNWVEFQGASNGVPLLFPGARASNATFVKELPYGVVVDLVVVNPGGMVHPMHLHGQRFWVLGSGNGEILTPDGKVNYSLLNSKGAIMRDTQPVANAIPTAALKAPALQGANGGSKDMVPESSGGIAGAASSSHASMAAGMPHGRNLLQGMPGMDGMQQPAPAPTPAPTSPPQAPAMGGMAMGGGSSKTPAPTTATKPSVAGSLLDNPQQQAVANPAEPAEPARGSDNMFGMSAPATTSVSPINAVAAVGSKSSSATNMTKMTTGNGMAGMAPAAWAKALTPGYAVIRFKANNPGVWAFHCHIDLHANSGMMMVFKVAAPAGRQEAAGPWSLPKNVRACGLMNDNSVSSMDGMNASEAPLPTVGGPTHNTAVARLPAAGVLVYLVSALAIVMMGRMV